jgi:hypothetical protein
VSVRLALRAPLAPRAPRGGFGLIEAVVSCALLVFALLGYVGGTLSGRSLAEEEGSRSAVLHAVTEFMETLRADPDWETLHERLLDRQQGDLPAAAKLAPYAVLSDGRVAWAANDYYAALTAAPLGLRCVVDVPAALSVDKTEVVLREDAKLPSFMLPADLNGDGRISSAPCTNYIALPVVVTFRWTTRGGDRQLKLSAWLRRST